MDGHLSVLVDHSDAAPVIHLSGDLDLGSADQLLACVEQLRSGGHDAAVLDLGRLEVLDSSGIRALVQASRVLAITVRNPSGHVAEVLKVTGMDRHLDGQS
jgi:anti-anti-sigma factor